MGLSFPFLILISVCSGVINAGPEYDFEDPQEVNVFNVENAKGAITISGLQYKSGSHSLLWQWSARTRSDPPAKLTTSLSPNLKLEEKELKNGGLKFWMYRETALPSATMEIIFHGENSSSAKSVATSPTTANLNFKGWRAVWIGYQEFGDEIKSSFTAITSVEFKITSISTGKLFLDAIFFATSIRKQSRDLVVPKVGSMARTDDPPFYDDKDFWQQSLRWHTTTLSRSTTAIPNVDSKMKEIQGIEARLENWYANVNEPLKTIATRDDFAIDLATDPEGGIDYQKLKQKRWKLLKTDIEAANVYYHKIDFIKKRPPLFSKVEELGVDSISEDPNFKSKFGFVFARILLPLSLEYNFMTREAEVNTLANRVCNKLKSSDYLTVLQAITEITGGHHTLVDAFQKTILDTFISNLTCSSTKTVNQVNAIDMIHLYNEIRWERIKALLLYVEDQGWAEGSGLGSIDHEMNKAGSGFMHSMFLLRNTLRRQENIPLLNRLLGAMKWFNDFNEIYQDKSNYIYDGTTADRMRTILLYRLMIILIVPNAHKENKVRDLEHLRIWAKHALKVNKGLGGVIKPDFTGFHHKSLYGSAYVPHALHNAALVQYLLEGTENFKLDDMSKHNLREALRVMRMTAVKYSSPNGIGGRFPGYNNSILAEHFAAYAYISYSKEGSTEKAKGRDMFLRLFDHLEPSVKAYLEDGTIKSGIYYWNTIGQLGVFKKIAMLNCTDQCRAESPPSGHWSKNFAGLSIHRRANWAVAAKGFNRYTWDYEGNAKENVFGAFASHGSLQISNSESSLKSFDVSQGWDWTRVPGATTIKAELSNIALSKSRNYNPGNFSGGVSFIGSTGSQPRNGVFGMFYKNPNYDLSKNKASPMGRMVFEFKKSYFFYNNLIVCLGSDIKFQSRDVENYYAQTTLFQDKLVDSSKTSTIKYGTTTHDLRLLLKRQYRWKSGDTVTLVDTNGNTYQVKNAREQGLNIQVQDQDSVASNGCDKTKARYATAWIKHSSKQPLPCSSKADNAHDKRIRNYNANRKNVAIDRNKNSKTINGNNYKKKDAQSENFDNKYEQDNEKKVFTEKLSSKATATQHDDRIQLSPKRPKTASNSSNVTGKATPAHQNVKPTQNILTKNLKTIAKSKKNAAKLTKYKVNKLQQNSTDSIFVNGINVNLGSGGPSQAIEVPNYIEPSIDHSSENILEISKEKPMFLPSHVDKIKNQGIDIDEEDEKSPSIDDNVENDRKYEIFDKTDSDGDNHNVDSNGKEVEMDGTGIDIDYNDSSMDKELEPIESKPTISSSSMVDSEDMKIAQLSKTTPEYADAAKEPSTSTAAAVATKLAAGKEKVYLKNNNLSDIEAPGIPNKHITSKQETNIFKGVSSKDKKKKVSKTSQKLEYKNVEDLSKAAESNLRTEKATDTEKDPAITVSILNRNVQTSEMDTFMPRAIDTALSFEQNTATTGTAASMMSNYTIKVNPEYNQTEQIERSDDNGDKTKSQNFINKTATAESKNINTLSNAFKPTINGTFDYESQANEADLNGDNASRNNDQSKDDMTNESIDSHIISLNTEKDDGIDEEEDKKEEKSTLNQVINKEILAKESTNLAREKQGNKHFENDEMNLNKHTGHVEGTTFDHDLTTQAKNMIQENLVKHFETTKKIGIVKSLRPNAYQFVSNNKKTAKIDGNLGSQEEITINNKEPDRQKTIEREKSKNGGKQFTAMKTLTNINISNTKQNSNSTENEGNSKKKKLIDYEGMVIDRASQLPANVKTEKISFKSKKSRKYWYMKGNNFSSPSSEQLRLQSKIMQQKHAEVKRKMKIKLKLKAKSTGYNKFSKAMKTAIQSIQEGVKENQQQNKGTFYFDDTLTNKEHSSEEKSMQEDEDHVDDSVNYDEDTTATTTSSYEYAIIIKGGSLDLLSRYKVIAKTSTHHAVEFSNLPDYSDASVNLYAYTIFENPAGTEYISSGPVLKTSMPCMIMAELRTDTLHLALSNPAISFQDDQAMKNKKTCNKANRKGIRDKFSPANSDEVRAKMMFCVEGASTNITVSLRLTKGLSTTPASVKVDGKLQKNVEHYLSIKAASKEVTFLNLTNGFTTEVALKLI